MTSLLTAIDSVIDSQIASVQPLGIILAGHNGSGKSTMWAEHFSPKLQIPIINADRMMLSVLPDLNDDGFLPDWAARLRDENESWMQVAQGGVSAFVELAMTHKVAFAMETVFSHWNVRKDGTVESKIQLIEQMQAAGYFVLLCFVGLTNASLSMARVDTRIAKGGHAVPRQRLLDRFPRTQKAIGQAVLVANASILADNSLGKEQAFSVCRIQMRERELFDIRRQTLPPAAIRQWMDIVCPLGKS